MEPKLGDIMVVNPSLTGLPKWVEGSVIDIEHNPFMGLVISIKDKAGRIFFGQAKYFIKYTVKESIIQAFKELNEVEGTGKALSDARNLFKQV